MAFAGSPHFVGTPTISRDGDALTVSGKVAGLGDETQIKVAVTADVACINRGNSEPRAENKHATIAQGDFPVQNGKALFSVTGTGTTDPDCDPPMTLAAVLSRLAGSSQRRLVARDETAALTTTPVFLFVRAFRGAQRRWPLWANAYDLRKAAR